MTIGVVARVTVKAGCERRFEDVIGRHAAIVRASEPGNLLYRLFRSPDAPGTYIFMEIYASREALEIHRGMAVFETGRAELRELWDGLPTIEILDAVDLSG